MIIMFFKPVECNEFIFYGIFVSIGEVSTAMKRFHYKGDMYSFIYSHGLEYMRVGDDERANEFVIGKKLDFYHNFLAVKLKFDENGMYMQHLDGKKIEVKLSEKEEVDLKKQIFELGFFSNLQYYMIHSYKANRIE